MSDIPQSGREIIIANRVQNRYGHPPLYRRARNQPQQEHARDAQRRRSGGCEEVRDCCCVVALERAVRRLEARCAFPDGLPLGQSVPERCTVLFQMNFLPASPSPSNMLCSSRWTSSQVACRSVRRCALRDDNPLEQRRPFQYSSSICHFCI